MRGGGEGLRLSASTPHPSPRLLSVLKPTRTRSPPQSEASSCSSAPWRSAMALTMARPRPLPAAPGRVAVEAVQHPFALGRRDARAGVADLQPGTSPASRTAMSTTVRRGVADGIVDEVAEQGAQCRGVGLHRDSVVERGGAEIDPPGIRHRGMLGHHAARHIGQRYGLARLARGAVRLLAASVSNCWTRWIARCSPGAAPRARPCARFRRGRARSAATATAAR